MKLDSNFKNIGLVGRLGNRLVIETLREIIRYMDRSHLHAIIDKQIASELPNHGLQEASRKALGEMCDLVIVVGGDGCLLGAARSLAQFGTPILGVNRGRLGFLTDVIPSDIVRRLDEVFSGQYSIEPHFLIGCSVKRGGSVIGRGDALNDIVLHPGKAVQMIEFELYVEGQFVYRQRSDGLIVSTPTGSTAYSLSAGGAIMHPSLDAISLVPMYPHTLGNRPIVVNGNSEIKIVIVATKTGVRPHVSCDGQDGIPLEINDIVYVRKKPHRLQLIHPLDHNFYETCRSKLGWGSKPV